MVKSFWRLRGVDPGFDPHGVLTFRLDLPAADYRDPAAVFRFVRPAPRAGAGAAGGGERGHRRLRCRSAAATPTAATRSRTFRCRRGQVLPILGNALRQPRLLPGPGHPGGRRDGPSTAWTSSAAVREVLVSRGLAERFWPGKSPLGRRLAIGVERQPRWYTIVGVVGDVRDRGLEEKPEQTRLFPDGARRRARTDLAPPRLQPGGQGQGRSRPAGGSGPRGGPLARPQPAGLATSGRCGRW